MSDIAKNEVEDILSNPVALWTPPSESVTPMDSFRKAVNDKHSLSLRNYNELYQWSITNNQILVRTANLGRAFIRCHLIATTHANTSIL